METLVREERTLTELDHRRLERLIAGAGAPAAEPGRSDLDDVLGTADLVPSRQVGPDVVTMYSQALLRDLETGTTFRLTICYPDDAEPGRGFVSVLSPVGSGLLGRRVGSVAHWRAPNGIEHAAEVVALLFQPEASGDFTL